MIVRHGPAAFDAIPSLGHWPDARWTLPSRLGAGFCIVSWMSSRSGSQVQVADKEHGSPSKVGHASCGDPMGCISSRRVGRNPPAWRIAHISEWIGDGVLIYKSSGRGAAW
jgi:hypothetical protein